MADTNRVSTAGIYVIDGTPVRQVSTAGVYVIHGPNQRRVSTAGVYAIESQAPPLEPTVTAPTVLAPGAAEVFPRGTTEVALSWSPSTETSAPTTPLRYDAQWRVVGAGTWNALFTGHATPDVLEYAWTGLTGGAREVRVGGYRQGEVASQIAWSATRQFTIAANQKPTTPQILTPAEGEVVTGMLVVSFLGSEDPDGDELVYRARMRKTPSGAWITLADGTPHTTPLVYDLTTLTVAGEYEIELWAVDSEGLASDKAVRKFTTDPNTKLFSFTAPESGSEHNDQVILQWNPVAGATGYWLYFYKPGSDTRELIWGPGPAARSWVWDTSNAAAYPEGEYTVEGFATLPGGDTPSDYLALTISRSMRPTKPTVEVTYTDFQRAGFAGSPYHHPEGVAHKATQFDLFTPRMDIVTEGGWTGLGDDPIFPAPTTTWDATISDFESIYGIRVRYQDVNNKWSEWSSPKFFFAGDRREYSWRPAWEVIRSSWFQPTGLSDDRPLGILWGLPNSNGCKYSASPLRFSSCPTYEPAGMLRVTDGTYGSARVSGYGMIHGAGHGRWAWRFLTSDSNKIGVMLGDGMDMPGASSATGAAMWLSCGVLSSLNHQGGECTSPPSGWHAGVSIPNSAHIAIRVRYKDKYGNHTSKSGLRYGIGPMAVQTEKKETPPRLKRYPSCLNWDTGSGHPWYKMEMKVQRYLDSPTGPKSVVYARGQGPGLNPYDVLEDDGDPENGDHYWHLRVEVPGVVECGYPGYNQSDIGGLWGTAQRSFAGLKVQALPDLGRAAPPETLPPPDPREPAPDVPCTTPQPEAPPEAAVLFPAPPDWEEGVRERVTYPTDVIAGQDDSEQRIRLREHPRRGLAYTAVCLDAGEVAYLQALLWERQAMRWAVPLWMDGVPLAAPLPAGSTVIPAGSFDPGDHRFVGRTRWALWQGVQEYELVEGNFVPPILDPDTGEELSPGGIALVNPTTRAWGEMTALIPAEAGWLTLEQTVEHVATTALRLPVEFTLDADGAV